MPGTAVIIPFFQRKPGLLAAAVRSVLAQEDAGAVTIVVCDDSSPSPAEVDLDMLDAGERDRVVLISQTNGGCGPARNAALDAMPADAEWIAFLDSDDRWRPWHLARSIAALREGYDFCFANVQRESEALTHFEYASFKPEQHEPIGALPGLYRFTGDFLTQNLAMSPVSVSSVVMRASTLGDLRFPPIVFEDLMTWFEVARRGVPVAFDGTLQVHYGSGNITLAESWKSQKALKLSLLYHQVFMRVLREFMLTAVQRAILETRMAQNRRSFATAALALLRGGRAPAWRVIADFVALDARVGTALLGAITTETRRRLSNGWRVLAT